jgi:malyl-CoA/(S)-citramalyl-CoA lyase
MKSPAEFYRPLAVGAPAPATRLPVFASRMLHFFDPSSASMRERVTALGTAVDVVVGNLEDAIPADRKRAAREGLVTFADATSQARTGFWVRVNALDSPWVLDDLELIARDLGDRVGVLMIPKVEGPEDIAFVDRHLALLEARYGLSSPIMVHAILETARAVAEIEQICLASPRLQGVSLGPADLAASRRMKTTRVGGGHPDYVVRADPDGAGGSGARPGHLQDLWHYTMARMVDACALAGITPYYGPFGDIADTVACEDQFRNAYLMGCAGAWTLHPVQIEIARRVFSPPVAEVEWARRVIAAAESGVSATMIDGTMQDDATFRQCRVVLELAQSLADIDPVARAAYGR